jgi:predicted phage terminase large subunit-like protein
MVEINGEVLHAELFRALVQKARRCFLTYVMLFNPPNSGRLIVGDLHRSLIGLVQDVVDGKESKRQIVSVPPQHGKSTIISKEAVSWILGRLPGVQVALTGFSHELTSDFSKEVKDRTQQNLYRLIFPDSEVIAGYDKADNWMLSSKSAVRAKSTGRKLTGRRVDWLVIDDPHSGRRDAESGLSRKRVMEWYFGDCLTRLSPEAVVFIVMTRWHPEDMVGQLTSEDYVAGLEASGQKTEAFNYRNYPAICENEQDDILERRRGEALFPEVRTLPFLESIRSAIPVYEWSSQYQGYPMTSSSGHVDFSKFNKIQRHQLPAGIEMVRGWDLALTTKNASDYTAGALCGYDKANDHFYIIDMFHDKQPWAIMKQEVVRLSLLEKKELGVNRIAMEAVSGFLIGYAEIKEALLGEVKVTKRNPTTDKLMRAQPWFNKIEAGKVSIVAAPWNRPLFEELMVFPDGSHDDQIDAVSIAFEEFTKPAVLLIA